MKEDYLDYNDHVVDDNSMVGNKSNRKNYRRKEKNISFNIPLADMLGKEDVEKLKLIK